MALDSTRDPAPAESLRDFVARFSSVFSLEGNGDRTINPTTNPVYDQRPEPQTRSTAQGVINQPANYNVTIPAEGDSATGASEAVKDPSSPPTEEPRLQAPDVDEAEAAHDDNEKPVPAVSGFIVTKVAPPEDFAQTRSATVPIDSSHPSARTKGAKKTRKAVARSKGARSGKHGLTAHSSVVKMPSGDTRRPAPSAASLLPEPGLIQSASIPIDVQREIVQAGDDSFRVKVPLLGRLPPAAEPKSYRLSTLGVRKDHAKKENLPSRVARTEPAQRESYPQQPQNMLRQNMLRRHLLEALGIRSDGELQRVLDERYYNNPAAQRLPPEKVIERTNRFVDLAHSRLDARLAVIYLAYANWDFQTAVETYMTERYDEPDFSSAASEDAHQATSDTPALEVAAPTPLEPNDDDLLIFDDHHDSVADEGFHAIPEAPAPPQWEEFTIRDICPCNLDGHNCMLPLRCRFIRNAICTIRDCECYGKIHIPDNCQSLRDGQPCVDGGYPHCDYGHDTPADTGRSEQAGIHAAHHRGEV